RLPTHLRLRESVEALGTLIPARHLPVEVLADDRVGRGFDHRDVMRGVALGAFALGDVADRARDERSVLGFERAQRDLDRELGAVLATPIELQPGTHRPRVRVSRVALTAPRMTITETVRYEHLDAPTQ